MKSLAALSARKCLSIPVRRSSILALCIGFAMTGAFVPPAHAEDMPTPEEMQEMQKAMQEGMGEMQKAMDELDPETRKQVEQMMAHPPASSGADDGAQPVRDDAKLATVSTDALDDGNLKSYIEALQPKIAAALAAEARERAERIDTELQKTGDYLPNLHAAANGLAAWGAWPEATYLMGKAALAGGTTQDLNNLAAFLSMQHAETAALPILYTLNARYPNNSTLLNNLGQARYGLGDTEEAEKFLIAAVSISPLHPQANATLARVQAARGDQQAAQDSLHKAIQGGFSTAKEEALRKVGGKLAQADVRWRMRMPQDPLGLEKFNRPAYPKTAAELPAAGAAWSTFEESARVMQASLDAKARGLPLPFQAAKSPSVPIMSSQFKTQSTPEPTVAAGLQISRMPFLQKASKLIDSENEHYEIAAQRLAVTAAELEQKTAAESDKLDKRVEAIDAAGREKYRNVSGGYQFDYTCDEVKSAIDDYLNATVPAIEQHELDALETERKHTNTLAYLAQFTAPGTEFERAKLRLMESFVVKLGYTIMRMPQALLNQRTLACYSGNKQDGKHAHKLPDYNDIHCEYISTLDMPGLGSITSRCDTLEANFDPVVGSVKANWAMEFTGHGDETRWRNASVEIDLDGVTVGTHAEFDDDGIKSGGVSVGAGAGLGPKLEGGPLEIGVKAGVSAGLEFDRNGLSDVSISAGVESKTSSTIGKTEAAQSQSAVKAGANSTWSWNSGFSGAVSGGFDSSVF